MSTDEFWTTPYGVRIPKIIYGTAWKERRTADLVEFALRQGFGGIDTACQPKHYHEAGVGDGIHTCLQHGLLTRPELYLQTKFTPLDGHDPKRIPYDPKASLSKQVEQSFRVSLHNLKTDYLDCLVLHSPMPSFPQTLQVWQAMENLVQHGGVKQLGISNCYDLSELQKLYNASEIKPAVLQNRFFANTGYDKAIRQFCIDQGIIYQSFWALTANPNVLQAAPVQALAKDYERSAIQVFFRYLTQIGVVPLTGTTSIPHMQEDLAIFDFELTEDEISSIGQLLN